MSIFAVIHSLRMQNKENISKIRKHFSTFLFDRYIGKEKAFPADYRFCSTEKILDLKYVRDKKDGVI